MKKTIKNLKSPERYNKINKSEPFEFGFEIDEIGDILSIIVNDRTLTFFNDDSLHWIRFIYNCFTDKTYFTENQSTELMELYKSVTIPSDVIIYSNNSNPYVGSLPNDASNRRIYPENLIDLCESFMAIQDTEDRFVAYWIDPKTMVFYYSWKE